MVIPSPTLILMGILIGVIVAAPVGPVNVLCIQRTLERGFFAGLAAGTGAVLGDGLIALVAAFGINAISDLIVRYRTGFQLVGGLILIAFGVKLYLTRTELARTGASSGGPDDAFRLYVWSIPQTFFLTITNPGAVLGMFAIVGGAGTALGGLNSSTEAITLVLAVMGGSFCWWFVIARTISTIRHKLTAERLRLVNRIAGLVLAGFGAALLVQLLARTKGLA